MGTAVKTSSFGWLAATVVALAISVVAVSCGSDDDPDPAPTAAPAESPAPTATPTEAPTPSTTQPAESLRSLRLTPETTGQDILDRVSEAEQTCIRTAFEADYETLRTSSVLPFAGPALFGCLQTESAVTLGLLLLGGLGEEWSPDVLSCMIDFGVENPTAIFSTLASQQANLPFVSSFFFCLSTEGKIELLFSLQSALDAFTTAEHHLMGTVLEADAACIRDSLSEEEFATLLAGTLH